jgi:hypothetical protein
MNKHADIVERIGKPATLEQMAEECCELGKAALKLARVMRGENPTPVTEEQAVANLIEEVGDVRSCMLLVENWIELITGEQEEFKLNRTRERCGLEKK